MFGNLQVYHQQLIQRAIKIAKDEPNNNGTTESQSIQKKLVHLFPKQYERSNDVATRRATPLESLGAAEEDPAPGWDGAAMHPPTMPSSSGVVEAAASGRGGADMHHPTMPSDTITDESLVSKPVKQFLERCN